MRRTVKVLCRTLLFLCLFASSSVCKRYYEDDYLTDVSEDDPAFAESVHVENEYENNRYRNENPNTEFRHERNYVHKKVKRSTAEDFENENDGYWNEDEEPIEMIQTRVRRSNTYEYSEPQNSFEPVYRDTPHVKRERRQSEAPHFRYANHRYEDEDQINYQRSPPVLRNARASKHQYEVYEPEEDIPVSDVRRPMRRSFVAEAEPTSEAEHYHRVVSTAGAPQTQRYVEQIKSDQQTAATGKSNKHEHHHESGGGKQSHSQHHAADGKKADKGYKSVHHHEKGAKGVEDREKQSSQYDEHGGEKKRHHDVANHFGEHEEEAHGHRGGKFDEKKGHKKGHKTKGYHNKYHKDEYHKEHKFYDDYHKSGSHLKYGNFHSKQAAKESGEKKGHHLDAANHADQRGKKGHVSKGHVDADHKSHSNKGGHEEHHAHHSDYGKKGGHAGGKEYGYAHKH